jgi:hypothetical protein
MPGFPDGDAIVRVEAEADKGSFLPEGRKSE